MRIIRNKKGLVLPIILLWSLILVLEVGGMSLYAASRTRQIQSQMNYMRTFYMAEAAVDKIMSHILLFAQTQGRPPNNNELANMAADQLNVGEQYSFRDVDAAYNGGTVTQQLEFGT